MIDKPVVTEIRKITNFDGDTISIGSPSWFQQCVSLDIVRSSLDFEEGCILLDRENVAALVEALTAWMDRP